MSRQSIEKVLGNEDVTLVEYTVTIDGVIAAPQGVSETEFFDGLLDTIIAYVEQYKGQAGLSMSHQQYAEDDNIEVDTGGQAT